MRPRRSGLVIGLACARIEVSAASEGGSAALCACANDGTARPATSAAAEDQKKERRVNMNDSSSTRADGIGTKGHKDHEDHKAFVIFVNFVSFVPQPWAVTGSRRSYLQSRRRR